MKGNKGLWRVSFSVISRSHQLANPSLFEMARIFQAFWCELTFSQRSNINSLLASKNQKLHDEDYHFYFWTVRKSDRSRKCSHFTTLLLCSLFSAVWRLQLEKDLVQFGSPRKRLELSDWRTLFGLSEWTIHLFTLHKKSIGPIKYSLASQFFKPLFHLYSSQTKAKCLIPKFLQFTQCSESSNEEVELPFHLPTNSSLPVFISRNLCKIVRCFFPFTEWNQRNCSFCNLRWTISVGNSALSRGTQTIRTICFSPFWEEIHSALAAHTTSTINS